MSTTYLPTLKQLQYLAALDDLRVAADDRHAGGGEDGLVGSGGAFELRPLLLKCFGQS